MKKKKARIAAALLATAFAGAVGTAHLEWVGYEYFDRKDGSNALCQIDPHCRALNPDEITVARKYFGDRIDYKNVKVFSRAFMLIPNDGYSGMTPNGHLYFAKKHNYSPNFTNTPELMRSFIHEMTHVAQYQSGVDVPRQAFVTWLKHGFNYYAAYDYEIEKAPSYNDLNLEQQADMMADYYTKRSEFELLSTSSVLQGETFQQVRAADLGPVWLKQQCKSLKAYESKLYPTFPVRADALCKPPEKHRPKNSV
ncbi:MAG TPA: hypothetical protein VGD95_00270, partial [Micavibrio sp.]